MVVGLPEIYAVKGPRYRYGNENNYDVLVKVSSPRRVLSNILSSVETQSGYCRVALPSEPTTIIRLELDLDLDFSSLTMPTERELAISPIVQESVQHNTRVEFFPEFQNTTQANVFSHRLSQTSAP